MKPCTLLSSVFLLFSLLIPFDSLAGALKLSPFQRGAGSSATSDSEVDLHSLLHQQPTQRGHLMSDAVQLLDSLKQSPSCNRLAATNLILSCQALGSSRENEEQGLSAALDNAKSFFAARLAVCELVGAGASTPDECSEIFPSQPAGKKARFTSANSRHVGEQESIKPSELEPCLRSLESRPQWWTSYSNARQNAAVMCEAARIEIDREEQINRYKNLADTAFAVNEFLNASLANAESKTAQHRSFLEAVDIIRRNLLVELEAAISHSRKLFTELFSSVEVLRTSVAGVGSDVGNLGTEVRHSGDALRKLKEELYDIHSSVIDKRAEHTAVEKIHHEVNVELALSAHRAIEAMKSQHIEILTDEFATVHSALGTLNALTTSMQEKHVFLDQRLQVIDAAFHQFEVRSQALQHFQLQQIQNQSRLQASFKADLHIAQALIKDITVSAANLQSSIEETNFLFGNISSVGKIVGNMSFWLWTAFAFCLLSFFSTKLAVAWLLFSLAMKYSNLADTLSWFSVNFHFDPTTDYSALALRAATFLCFGVASYAVLRAAWPAMTLMSFYFRQYWTRFYRLIRRPKPGPSEFF